MVNNLYFLRTNFFLVPIFPNFLGPIFMSLSCLPSCKKTCCDSVYKTAKKCKKPISLFIKSLLCRSLVKNNSVFVPCLLTSGSVFSSAVPEQSRQLSISLDSSVQLRGDILIKCYHKRLRSAIREIIFRCQFHTCTVAGNQLAFQKHELDEASQGTAKLAVTLVRNQLKS